MRSGGARDNLVEYSSVLLSLSASLILLGTGSRYLLYAMANNREGRKVLLPFCFQTARPSSFHDRCYGAAWVAEAGWVPEPSGTLQPLRVGPPTGDASGT